jgi:ABC-type branched-subunit amino acid transport system substrate-binding protein
MRAYCQSYRDAYNNREPIKYGAIAYDMLHIIADTLKDQGSMSNEDITKRIQSAFTNKTYTGITGSFSFDNNGNITERSMELRIAKDGQFVKLGE